MPPTTEIPSEPVINNKEIYVMFIRFLRSSLPKLNETISSGLTTKEKDAAQSVAKQIKTMTSIFKVQCVCTLIKKDNYNPIIDASFRVLYQNYPTEFKLSDHIPVRNTVNLSFFREQDWTKIISVLTNDIYASFYKMTTNMPLFILQLDSLPLDLRTFFRQKSLTIGNVTALCHKEILSKFCFFADEDDCVKMVVWKDSSISVIGEPFSVKKGDGK